MLKKERIRDSQITQFNLTNIETLLLPAFEGPKGHLVQVTLCFSVHMKMAVLFTSSSCKNQMM